jgi:hypothetical protein
MLSAIAYLRSDDERGKWPVCPGNRKFHTQESTASARTLAILPNLGVLEYDADKSVKIWNGKRIRKQPILG